MPLWDYYKVLAYVSSFSVLVPLAAVYSKRNSSATFWFLFIYLGISLVTEIVLLLVALSGKSNIYILELFEFCELFLLIKIFKTSGFFSQKASSYLNLIPLAGIVLFVTGYLAGWTGIFDGFSHSSLIFISVLVFYKMFGVKQEDTEEIHPFFWFNLAFFCYFSASFFLFLFGNLVQTFDTTAKLLWTIHLLANMLFYFILTLGIWKHKAT